MMMAAATVGATQPGAVVPFKMHLRKIIEKLG
jgi:hypothetical protein